MHGIRLLDSHFNANFTSMHSDLTYDVLAAESCCFIRYSQSVHENQKKRNLGLRSRQLRGLDESIDTVLVGMLHMDVISDFRQMFHGKSCVGH